MSLKPNVQRSSVRSSKYFVEKDRDLAMILKGGEVGPSCSHVEPLHSHSTEGQVLENDPSFVSQSVPLSHY